LKKQIPINPSRPAQ